MKNPTYLETVARNHARVAAMLDRRTADIFASSPAGAEDLTLAGEVQCEQAATKPAAVHVDTQQGDLFA